MGLCICRWGAIIEETTLTGEERSMYFETREGLKLYYEVSGSGEPLMMLHGNGEDCTIFDQAVPLLEQRFTVYRVDTRGHGKSSPVEEFHYEEMAEDIRQLIEGLQLEKPTVYGFSDGGILAVLLAIRHPELLGRILGSGVNCNPRGMVRRFFWLGKVIYFFTRDPKFKLMLTEPNITDEMLESISIPVFMTAGSKDLVRAAHVWHMDRHIPGCVTRIFQGEDHGSYIVHSEKIARYILEVC